MSRANPTRDDVAALAGTSSAVVSYVINSGPRRVSPERTERVLRAMAELGYYPNAHARSLAATQTNTIGLIVPNISNAYFADLAEAIEDAAMARGRMVFLANSSEDPAREQGYISSLLEQRVDGVVFVGVTLDSSISRLRQRGIRVSVVDREVADPHVTAISIDHRVAARKATEHLLGHGHTEIACVTGPETQSVAELRRQGWMDALMGVGIDPRDDLVVRSPYTIGGGHAAAKGLFRARDVQVTAAFVASDEQARGVIAEVGSRGLVVPRDLAITSVDGTSESAFSNPPLTTVRQPYSLLANAAVESLLSEVVDDGGAHVMPTELIIRQSCGCP